MDVLAEYFQKLKSLHTGTAGEFLQANMAKGKPLELVEERRVGRDNVGVLSQLLGSPCASFITQREETS